MLERALHQRIIEDYHQQQKLVTKQSIFNVFNDLLFEKRKKEKHAKIFRFRNSVGRAFYAWSDWVYMVGIGLDRTRWNAARRYEVIRFKGIKTTSSLSLRRCVTIKRKLTISVRHGY